MTQIQFRDERLFAKLIAGACTFARLFEMLEFLFGSESALRQRLSQLQQNGFVQSRLYVDNTAGKRLALYALSPSGMEWLVVNNRANPEEIRTLLPNPNTVAHELAVIDIVRRVRQESMEIPYTCKYYDDPACRKHKKLLGLKAPVPDLLCDISAIKSSVFEYRVAIEVHDTTPILTVVDKVLKQEHQTIFLTNERAKLRELQSSMWAHSKLQGKVYFALTSDFCADSGGIFGTNFWNLNDKKVSLYP